jgi:hypothetical protein
VVGSVAGEAAELATGFFLEEGHIFVFKLNRLFGVVAQALYRVFAYP